LLGSAGSVLGAADSSRRLRCLGGELGVLAASAWRNLEKDAIESCIAAGRGGRLRMDAQMVPTIKAATGIINHSKTFMELATVPSVPLAFDVQRSLDAHPGDRAVAKALLFPNRHSRLDLVDQFFGRCEGLPAMFGGDSDDDGSVARASRPVRCTAATAIVPCLPATS
jgi:hypothetical protein